MSPTQLVESAGINKYLVSTAHDPWGIHQQQQPHPTPKGQGSMLFRRFSSNPGWHGFCVINACCSSCSIGKQRRQSGRSHLHRAPKFCTNSNIAMENTTTVTPQRKRVPVRYGQDIAIQMECKPSGGNNTPEEATATEAERQLTQISDIMPEKAIATKTERFCTLFQFRKHYYENNLLEKKKLSTATGASSTEAGASSREEGALSSPEIGESSSTAGALTSKVDVSLIGSSPAFTPVDAQNSTARAAPDVPHHEIASTRPNSRVEDTFDQTHATESPGTKPPTTCMEFTYAERDSFRISEERINVI